MSKQTIIKAEQLNATHLGKKVTILDDGETVMSGRLKEFSVNQYTIPAYSPSTVPVLKFRTVTDIIMHLSNRLDDDIKATVHGDTELVIEVNGK